MKALLVIAGEASGDLHGAEILRALKAKRPDLRVVGVGGSLMTPYLDRKLADVQDLAVVGLVEVLRHLPRLRKLFSQILAVAAGEGIGGDRETSQQLELALTQSRSEWSIAPMNHLNVYIP